MDLTKLPTNYDITECNTTQCVVVWRDGPNSYSWFLGYVNEQSNNMLTIDHLTCVRFTMEISLKSRCASSGGRQNS